MLTGCPTSDDSDEQSFPFGQDDDDDDECDEALSRLDECGLTVEETPYSWYVEQGGCDYTCELRCIADARCEDLDMDYDTWEESGCSGISDATGACIVDCSECDTPLVLSFDGAPVVFDVAGGQFDFGRGPVVTDWPSPATPWLTRDRNGDGRVNDAGELFGDATVLSSGARARNGFEALAELDAQGDGRIDPGDPAWITLLVWRDLDGDHTSDAGELTRLGADGVIALELSNRVVERCDDRGNCERERSAFHFTRDGKPRLGAVVDVYLRGRPPPIADRGPVAKNLEL